MVLDFCKSDDEIKTHVKNILFLTLLLRCAVWAMFVYHYNGYTTFDLRVTFDRPQKLGIRLSV